MNDPSKTMIMKIFMQFHGASLDFFKKLSQRIFFCKALKDRLEDLEFDFFACYYT